MSSEARILLTYGRFDMFHQGHVAFLRQVSQLADEVIVGCATDALAQANGTPCYMPFEQRRAVLESCRYVSRVIAQTEMKQQRRDIVNYNACTLAIGPKDRNDLEDLTDIALILYLPRHVPKQSTPTWEDYRHAVAN